MKWLREMWLTMFHLLRGHESSRKTTCLTEQEERQRVIKEIQERQHELARKAHYYEVRAKVAALRREHGENH